MAAATYATDIATTAADTTKGTIYRQDATGALTTTGCLGTLTWAEPTGSIAGGTPQVDTDYFILGVATANKTMNATGVGGLGVTTTNAAAMPTDGAFMVWTMFFAPNSVASQSSGGIQVLVGSSVANYSRYYVDGDDTHPYGGWKCHPINPTVTASATQGTPSGTYQFFGTAYNVDNAVAKGQPAAVGGIRFGRCYIMCTNGDLANGYATFAGAGTFNDYNDGTNGWNRLGLFQPLNGAYYQQGLLQMGSSSTAVDFRDSNKVIFIQKTPFVTANFNTFEIQNASSRVDWTGISIQALGTVSKGRLLVIDNADVNIDSCTFTDMDAFTFQTNSTVVSTIFRRCGLITQGGATVTGCTIDKATGVTAMNVSSPANLGAITDTTFISDGTGYAITLTGTASDCTLSGVVFTGYAASNGTTGNEAVFVNIASGTMTINITNGGNTPSIRTAGATVTVANSKTFIVTNIVDGSEVRIFRQSDLVELGGAETVGASPAGVSNVTVSSDPDNSGRYRVSYSYAYTTDTAVFVVVLHNNYQAIRPAFTLKSTDSSLQVTQIADRQYSNPA